MYFKGKNTSHYILYKYLINPWFLENKTMVISFGRVVVPYPKIIINLSRNYEELHCKGETYRSSDSKILFYTQTNIMLFIFRIIELFSYSFNPILKCPIKYSYIYLYILKGTFQDTLAPRCFISSLFTSGVALENIRLSDLSKRKF